MGWRVMIRSPAEGLVDADRDTLATALYVRTDDLLRSAPQHMAAAAGWLAHPVSPARTASAGPARPPARRTRPDAGPA